MSRSARILALSAVLGLLLVVSSFAQAEKPGTISGVVVDAKTGEALLGVNIFVEGTSMGAQCDLDGAFTVRNVPPGTYTLRASSVDYNTMTVTEVVVKSGEVTKVNFTLTTKVLELDNQITVTAKAVKNTEAIMLKDRQASAAVQDAISSELISKAGAGSAADAAEKITGATVVDGKNVFIRGLGDRYGKSELNGMVLPSAEATRGGVSLDLVPTNILNNIVVTKSFTPDKAGDFAGGSVNLTTKDFPDQRTLVFSTSASHNSNTTGKDVLTQETISPKAWLADDDGYYNYAAVIDKNPELWSRTSAIRFPNITVRDTQLGDTMLVQTREAVINGFSNQFQPSHRTAPWNQGYSLSFGDNWQLFDRPLGITSSYSYSREFVNTTGYRARYKNGTVGNSYDDEYNFDVQKTKDIYELGGMLGMYYQVADNHQVGWRYVYNRTAESVGQSSYGPYKERVQGPDAVREFTCAYGERRLKSSQFDGKHALLNDRLRVKWRYQSADTYKDQPDTRLMSDEVYLDSNYYDMSSAIDFLKPIRIYQYLEGKNHALNFDFEVPLAREAKIKFGSADVTEERKKRVTTFYVDRNLQTRYTSSEFNGDPNNFFETFGITGVSRNAQNNATVYTFSDWWLQNTPESQQYDGKSKVDAFYGMVEFAVPYMSRLRVITGMRYEETLIDVEQWSGDSAHRQEYDRLHSLNFVYALNERMNMRLSYGETLARPTIREISPGQDQFSDDYSRMGGLFEGNPDLQLTDIKNYDLRWEWFRRPGEVFAFTAFFKDFVNPIEIAISGPNGGYTPVNAPDARVRGIELEMRSRLDVLWAPLADITLGGNFTLVDAWMKLGGIELTKIRERWPNADSRRDMFNQSPYILNLDLSWDKFSTGTSVSMFYNVFGERLKFNSAGITADVYEMPRHQLDMTISQRILGPKFKLGIKNILNEDIVYKYLDRLPPEGEERGDQETLRYERGVTVSLGMTYDIW